MPISFQCPHCGVQTRVPPDPCPMCGHIRRTCPRCGSHSIRDGPWSWYVGTLGDNILWPSICNQCGHEFDARKPQADLARRKLRLFLIINAIGGLGIVIFLVLLGWVISVIM